MGLKEWRRIAGKTLEQCASLFGAGAWDVVWRWENHRAVPQPRTVIRIWVETAGQVDPNSLYALPPLPAPAMLARAERLEAEATELRRRAVSGGPVDAGPCHPAGLASIALGCDA